jgi:peptide/nickel transport system ATP-binding protein/oligopeptide transport system ATP-binding protein
MVGLDTPDAAPPDAAAGVGGEIGPLVEALGLNVSFSVLRGRLQVLDDVSFEIGSGETVGLVGESGSGKSVTALSLMRLLGEQGAIDSGAIRFGGTNLVDLSPRQMLSIRGRDISMIFQEPMTSLNPVYTVGFQIAEVLIEHFKLSRREATKRATDLMALVGIPDGASRVNDFPHQLSGGMRQRVMVAMAMACQPKLLIADEPTTALDVTIQAQILDLMRDLQSRFGTSVLLITHDMGVIARMARRVIVMYAGQILEEAPVRELFRTPRHPYTRLLLKSIPRVQEKRGRLDAITGTTPSPDHFPVGCRFHPRCPDATDICRQEMPKLDAIEPDHRVRCWHAGETKMKSQEA